MLEREMRRRKRRRRRQNEEKCESEENENGSNEMMTGSNTKILVRRPTFTVVKQGKAFESAFSGGSNKVDDDGNNDDEDCYNKEESSFDENKVNFQSHSDDSINLTHTINADTWKTESGVGTATYDVKKETMIDTSKQERDSLDRSGSVRPVPAPRKHVTEMTMIIMKESDKNSSDTDKDIMEIEVDDGNTSKVMELSPKQPESITNGETFKWDSSVQKSPKPKPRKFHSVSTTFPRNLSLSKSKSLEEMTEKVIASPRSVKSDPDITPRDQNKSRLVEESKHFARKKVKQKGRFAAMLERKKEKKGSVLSSVINLERSAIPSISSLLRDVKHESNKPKIEIHDNIDFEIDSPRLPQTEPNDKLYVQCKNGFYLSNREDIFKRDHNFLMRNRNGGRMEDSSTTSNMLKTGMAFQKYWSRIMMYIHGVLAGLGFGHVFAISSILYYFNKSEQFIYVYSCLALKIHFMFYTLIALSIISCLDGLDVSHTSNKHWRQICTNFPTSWFILFIYIASFLLTFVNHNAEFTFDAHQYGNSTRDTLCEPQIHQDMTDIFTCWYRVICARDVMVLTAWFFMSLTEYPHNVYLYLKELSSKYERDDSKLRVVNY